MMREWIGVYAGTFDPFTNGHLDIVEQAMELFDKVYILVAVNPKKQCLFSMEERGQMIREVINDVGFQNVEVASWAGATVDFAESVGAAFLIRGLRTVTDFEAEFEMAQNNAVVDPSCPTIFIPASPQRSSTSSTMVRNFALAKKIIPGSVHPIVERYIRDKMKF